MSDDAPSLPWPDVPRLCFGEGEPPQLNACVAWVLSCPHDLHGYVEGYRRAAVTLYESALEKPVSPDYLVFPLAFLWRHHVELALKDIIATGRQLSGEPWGFPDGHTLGKLWKCARVYVEDAGDPAAISNVEANITEFETIDPWADGFRYPLNRDRSQQSMPNAPTYVNLAVLHEAMEALANFLSCVSLELGRRLDYQMEMEASCRNE